MELWNDGIVGFQRKTSILTIISKINVAIHSILQFSKTHFSNIPAFHHSMIEAKTQASKITLYFHQVAEITRRYTIDSTISLAL
jgi:hypothetical protein